VRIVWFEVSQVNLGLIRAVRKGVFLGLLLFSLPVYTVGQEGFENLVTIALVTKIVRFVQWPELDPAPRHINLCVCLEGEPPAKWGLDPLLRWNGLKREWSYHLTKIEELQHQGYCEVVLFINSEGSNSSIERYLQTVQEQPVLTIGDHPHFLQSGGMILVSKVGDRPSIKINRSAVAQSGLKLSAMLHQYVEFSSARNEP
jgi:hypothetical protein